MIIFGIHSYGLTHFSVSANDTLTIIGSPGELVSIDINAGSSVDGEWASQDGLTLTLSSPPSFSTQLVEPKDQDWSDSIKTSMNNPDRDIILSSSLVIPSNLNANTKSITGNITGSVTFPEDGGLFDFRDSSEKINIPVKLVLTSSSTTFATTRLPLYILAVWVLVALPAYFRKR